MATFTERIRRAMRGEAGEGVISTGIAVLIMALIGAAMWVAFSGVFDTASTQIDDSVDRIGEDTSGSGGGTGGG